MKSKLGLVALVWGMSACVSKEVLSPEAPALNFESPCKKDIKDEKIKICRYDTNQNGKIDLTEKFFYNEKGDLIQKREEYDSNEDGSIEKIQDFYWDQGKFYREVVTRGKEKFTYDYKDGVLFSLSVDKNSDGHPEEIYIHNSKGDIIRFFFDKNSDGFVDSISEDLPLSMEGGIDPDGEDGIVYNRILKLSQDSDFDTKFDKFEFFFWGKEGSKELIEYDQNQDGVTNKIRKRVYGDAKNLILEKIDFDGDREWDSIWTLDKGWQDL